MGAITQAMAAACRGAGRRAADVDAEVAPVRIERRPRRRASCSRTAATIDAALVVSNADPKRTYPQARAGRRRSTRNSCAAVRGIKMDGPCGKLNLVLSRGAAARERAIRRRMRCGAAQFTLVPWLEGAQRRLRRGAPRPHRGGALDRLPGAFAASIDSLATPGRHVMTCFVQYLPYALAGSDWSLERERLEAQLLPPDRALRAGGRPFASSRSGSTRRSTSRASSASPKATSFTATCGPTSSSSCGRCRAMRATRRRCRALYLCGAGTHPGGGVTGAPGHNAAHRILGDLKRDRTLRRRIEFVRN